MSATVTTPELSASLDRAIPPRIVFDLVSARYARIAYQPVSVVRPLESWSATHPNPTRPRFDPGDSEGISWTAAGSTPALSLPLNQ